MSEFFDDWKLSLAKAATAAGTDDTLLTSAINMAGYEGVLFFTTFGTITATAVTSIKVQQSSDDGVADAYGDLAGTAVAVAADDDGQRIRR